MCNLPIVVKSDNTARIQEAHIMIGHILCDIIDRTFSKQFIIKSQHTLKKYKRVDIFVCNNGFGHIKRELGIIFNLNSKIDFLKFVIHVKHDHYKKFVCLIDEWYPNINMDNVKFEFESMKNMPDYSFNSSYKSFEYSLWLDELLGW